MNHAQDWKNALTPDEAQNQNNVNNINSNFNLNDVSASASIRAGITLNQDFNSQGITNVLEGVQYAIDQQGQLLARGLHDISYQLSRPRYTETHTNGHSWGGAQTITNELYEEHTITEGEAFTTGQNWSTAWAVDSSHAADLTFNYTIANEGTEYARELTGLTFNIYLGDDPNPIISYPAWEQFPNGKLENIFPGDSFNFASNPIPLTLEQMKRIDLGEPLTVVLADYSYGADELFYRDATDGGLTIFVEDGVEDGDELVDSYVIPTWGTETVLDVLTRYFAHGEDENGQVNSLWTPEFNGIQPPTWNEYFLSDIAWWNVYQTCDEDDPEDPYDPHDCELVGATPLHEQTAMAGRAILFRFNRDSDRDGYQDRVEMQYYCALPDTDPNSVYCADAHLRPEIHPHPEVIAAAVASRDGDEVTVLLKIANSGNFDIYGVDAVMYAPDDTVTIGNNTVGGNGLVRPGAQVAVGSLVLAPELENWSNSTAKIYSGGNYQGSQDTVYTFTVGIPGVVGQGSAALDWADTTGATGTLDLGSSYHAPLPIDLADGVQLGFDTGTLIGGDSFTVQALTPRDTFTYTIESEPYTPPVIVVSYSDPQGSHRFVTPIALESLSDDLSPYSGQMLPDARLDIIATDVFTPTGANTTQFVVNSPDPTLIEAGHLYLNFVMSGTLVAELPYTMTFQPGPNVYSVTWSTDVFTQTFDPEAETILIAFWTDAQSNIIDSAARPFSSFQEDPTPLFGMATTDEIWDFSTAQQGTLMQQHFTLFNTGFGNLLTYVGNTPGITINGPDSHSLYPADMAVYTMTIDTQFLPEGPFEIEIPIRTSDLDVPTRTLTVLGNITPMPPDIPGGETIHPLDSEVIIPGSQNQGTWITFTHALGPDTQSLHPVKVYSEDYATLWGVGREATEFGEGTAPGDMFGDGSDGIMPSSGDLNNNNGVGVGSVDGSIGSTTISVTDQHSVWRIEPGDVVLIHQTQGTGSGNWELNTAISDFSGSGTFTLGEPLQHTYSSSGSNRAQIIRVPQYTTCNVTGTVTPLGAWNGTWGGILAVMCNDIMSLSGGLNVSGFGFRGGVGEGVYQGGQNGESTDGYVGRGGYSGGGMGSCGGGSGIDRTSTSPACQRLGGGGSGGYDKPDSGQGDEGTGGGGGGGHATAGGGGGGGGDSNGIPPDSHGGLGGASGSNQGGGNGGNESTDGGNGGQASLGNTGIGGAAYGNANRGTGGGGGGSSIQLDDWDTILFGSGGGASGAYRGNNTGHHIGRSGGSGGGFVYIATRETVVSGYLQANGTNGVDADGRAGGGGGGAAGSILIRSESVSVIDNHVQALGGSGGTPNGASGGGGQGGTGRIRIEYCNTLTGSTDPTASTEQITCHIVEQNETDTSQGRLSLPETFTDGRVYQIQYGRQYVFADSGEQTQFIRLPKQLYTDASLALLISNTGTSSGLLDLTLDIGDNGTTDWTYNENSVFPTTLEITDVVDTLNQYLVSRTDIAWGDDIDVPMRIQINRQANVILTNLALTTTGSQIRYLRLPAQNYDEIDFDTRFEDMGMGSNYIAFTVDIGDNGVIDWSYAGSAAFPATFTSPNLAIVFNEYLSGYSGEVDVPVRITLSPFTDTSLVSFRAKPIPQPAIPAGTSMVQS